MNNARDSLNDKGVQQSINVKTLAKCKMIGVAAATFVSVRVYYTLQRFQTKPFIVVIVVLASGTVYILQRFQSYLSEYKERSY